jgi:hypothetical protein
MKKVLQLAVATAIATSVLCVMPGSAWAMPCAGGERLVGKTDAGWKCMNLGTGAIRIQAFS